MAQTDWFIISYSLPRKPSRIRVNIWRRLRRCGAINLSRSQWALPYSNRNHIEAVYVCDYIRRSGGKSMTIRSTIDAETASDMQNQHVKKRNQEYRKLLSDCEDLQTDINVEFIGRSYNYVVLNNYERLLANLKRRYNRIAETDFFISSLQATVDEFLYRMAASLELMHSELFSHFDQTDG